MPLMLCWHFGALQPWYVKQDRKYCSICFFSFAFSTRLAITVAPCNSFYIEGTETSLITDLEMIELEILKDVIILLGGGGSLLEETEEFYKWAKLVNRENVMLGRSLISV